MTDENYTGPMPEGWKGGAHVSKWWRGKMVHLYTLHKPCAECGAEMRIDVSKAALDGTAKNAGLRLKRCAVCRARDKATGTSSRPIVAGQHDALKHALEGTTPDDALIAANEVMREELKGLYAELRTLRQRLEKYEPEPRMPWET